MFAQRIVCARFVLFCFVLFCFAFSPSFPRLSRRPVTVTWSRVETAPARSREDASACQVSARSPANLLPSSRSGWCGITGGPRLWPTSSECSARLSTWMWYFLRDRSTALPGRGTGLGRFLRARWAAICSRVFAHKFGWIVFLLVCVVDSINRVSA